MQNRNRILFNYIFTSWKKCLIRVTKKCIRVKTIIIKSDILALFLNLKYNIPNMPKDDINHNLFLINY